MHNHSMVTVTVTVIVSVNQATHENFVEQGFMLALKKIGIDKQKEEENFHVRN